jgi:beta-galactosidase
MKTRGSGELVLNEMRSYARVFVSGKLVGTLDRRKKQDRLSVDVSAGATLDILVEGTGRINFTTELRNERQGINGPVTLGGREVTGWQVYPLPMDDLSKLSFSDTAPGRRNGPAFYRGPFEVADKGDSFLDTRGWGKGVVWVNGHALGRFWNVGPQQTLYLPAPWLRKGGNEITIFALDIPQKSTIHGLKTAVLDQMGSE